MLTAPTEAAQEGQKAGGTFGLQEKGDVDSGQSAQDKASTP